MCRNIVVLHGGHVSELETSGDTGRVFAGSILASYVHDPGDAQMVYLERKNEAGTKVSSVAARQESGYNRGIEHDRKNTHRERARGCKKHHERVGEAQTHPAATHFSRIDVVPTIFWHQRRDILHSANLPGACFDSKRLSLKTCRSVIPLIP